MSDQHRRDCLGIEGKGPARTPNLDNLARSGTRFGGAYCSNPVCTPSRASLLTGLYTHNHQAWNNTTPWPFEHKTMAHHFGGAGYMTALIGKMHFVDAKPTASITIWTSTTGISTWARRPGSMPTS
jgi:choline-sulfatase